MAPPASASLIERDIMLSDSEYNDIVSRICSDENQRKVYENNRFRRFISDMIDAELEDNIRHYNGRFFYSGPAVSCESVQDVLSNTKVKCQWDNLGLGYIVYPRT